MFACFAGAKNPAGMRGRPKNDEEVDLLWDEARNEGESVLSCAVEKGFVPVYCCNRLVSVGERRMW